MHVILHVIVCNAVCNEWCNAVCNESYYIAYYMPLHEILHACYMTLIFWEVLHVNVCNWHVITCHYMHYMPLHAIEDANAFLNLRNRNQPFPTNKTLLTEPHSERPNPSCNSCVWTNHPSERPYNLLQSLMQAGAKWDFRTDSVPISIFGGM